MGGCNHGGMQSLQRATIVAIHYLCACFEISVKIARRASLSLLA